jgi:hypothetical protein
VEKIKMDEKANQFLMEIYRQDYDALKATLSLLGASTRFPFNFIDNLTREKLGAVLPYSFSLMPNRELDLILGSTASFLLVTTNYGEESREVIRVLSSSIYSQKSSPAVGSTLFPSLSPTLPSGMLFYQLNDKVNKRD